MTKEQTQITAKQRAEEILKLRNGKRPINGINSRFPQLPERPGFKTHWFNDHKGKIEEAIRNGWTFSERPGYTDDKVDLIKNPKARIHIRGGSKEDLSDMFTYAMDIPVEIYNLDRKAKMAVADRKEKFIIEGSTENAGSVKDTNVSVYSSIQSNFKPD